MTTVLQRPASTTADRGSWAKTAGAARYEYWMQVRRPAVWLVVVGLIALRSVRPWPPELSGIITAHATLVADWAMNFTMLCPIGVGAVLADRARREARLDLDDLLASTPSGVGPRCWGKAIGATAATITPVALCWAALLAYLATGHGTSVIPIGIEVFATVILPGLIFISACSLTVPFLIGPPLYRLGLVGYWFWGNMVGPRYGIPTLAGTPFEAIGEYPAGAWFHGHMFDAADRGVHADTANATLSIASLLLTALATLIAAHLVLNRRSPS